MPPHQNLAILVYLVDKTVGTLRAMTVSSPVCGTVNLSERRE